MPDHDEFYLAVQAHDIPSASADYNEPSHFVHETDGDVVLSGYSGNVLAKVGTFRVIQVDAEGALAQHVPVFDVFDQEAVTFAYFEQLYDEWNYGGFSYKDRVLKALRCEDEVISMNLLILDRLEIFPNFRGRGYGLEALQCLIQRFRMGVGLIVMKPFPLQFEDPEPEELASRGLDGFVGSAAFCTRKLKRYYAQLGFKRIPRTPFMALPTIYRLEEAKAVA
jgi:GNAT superfamily N-acetyltransferase